MFHHFDTTFMSVSTTSNLRPHQVLPLPHYVYIKLIQLHLTPTLSFIPFSLRLCQIPPLRITFISSSSHSTLRVYQLSPLSPYCYIKFLHMADYVCICGCVRICLFMLHHKTITDFIGMDSNLCRRKVEITHTTWSTFTRGSPQCLQGHVT